MRLNIVTLPGDGVGPEVVAAAVHVLESVAATFGHDLKLTTCEIGGAAATSGGDPLPKDTLTACLAADAVLLGAVGGPAFDQLPVHQRPEKGLLRLRTELGAYANLRPAICFPGLETCSPLRSELVRGTDMLIVRELLGGIYFGEPRITSIHDGHREAVDTMRYSEPEIERIARVAFDAAMARRRKVTSVDKANVLDCSRLWREVVARTAEDYPRVQLDHMYVDSAAMALVSRPTTFDVILTENMFGDILSDEAGAIAGSIGMLPSASGGGKVWLYEPIHGSAPDIAGKGIANPIGTILSVAMMLRHSFHLKAEAVCVEQSVAAALNAGYRTRDLQNNDLAISTAEMGSKMAAEIRRVNAASLVTAHE